MAIQPASLPGKHLEHVGLVHDEYDEYDDDDDDKEAALWNRVEVHQQTPFASHWSHYVLCATGICDIFQ